MVVKKQLKKISKKIIILGLATSIIFTSCFSTKKMEVKAASIAAALSAWTLYDICLYVGGIAISALGIGAIYENRDDIAEFGKNVVDTMSSFPDEWLFGTYTENSTYIYGAECLLEIQGKAWDYIKEGGLTPSTAKDLTGDGFVDISDKDFELANTNFWTTSNGAEYLKNQIIELYSEYVSDIENSSLSNAVNCTHSVCYDGYWYRLSDGNFIYNFKTKNHDVTLISESQYCFSWNTHSSASTKTVLIGSSHNSWFDYYIDGNYCGTSDSFYLHYSLPKLIGLSTSEFTEDTFADSNLYFGGASGTALDFVRNNSFGECIYDNNFSVADWTNQVEEMSIILNDISTSLRSLEDVADMCSAITTTVAGMTDSMDIISDAVAEIAGTYNPVIDVVIPTPIPWNPDITRPIYATDLPKDITTDTDLPMPDGPSSDDSDEEIDLNGLANIFSILFYLIMIIIMLIYLFLACLSFIVMIFRIPPSSSMLPDEMVMGFDHLKTIMIPGFNISIYSFAMALIYLLIIFTVIKILRLEINDFKFPRPGKKP